VVQAFPFRNLIPVLPSQVCSLCAPMHLHQFKKLLLALFGVGVLQQQEVGAVRNAAPFDTLQ